MKRRQSLDDDGGGGNMTPFFKKIKCDTCDEKFSKEEQLMNHKQIVHGKDLQYDCKECGKYFSNMEDMRTHLQREHSYKKDR